MSEAVEDAVAVLRTAPIFAGLEPSELAALADGARSRHVRAGDLVYRRGDAASSLAIVRAGRLEVLTGEHDEAVATELSAGAVLGELGVLSGGRRSATVRAVRDSDLMEISASAFTALLGARPAVAVTLARTLAGRLQRSQDVALAPATISVLTVVALIPDPARSSIIDQLLRELGRIGRVQRSSVVGASR